MYENGSLTRILTENGYYSNKNYYFYIRNHLGSNAIVADMNGNIVQQNHFYPFGQTMAISSGQGAQPYKFTGKELDLENGLNLYDFEARTYDPSIGRFTTVDPLAEKYYSISPYAYCANNPINCIDPTGMDVYRYDDKTGEMILHKKTDDNFDQIGKFKTVKNKETGEKTYELKTKKDGTAKTRIDNIEKGILSDGINFKENNNVINVGGEGQATVAGFESFITQFSDMIDKEIGGFYYTPTGKNSISDISHIYVGKFQNNTDQKAFATPKFHLVRPDLVGTLDIHTDFHTHLSRFPESAKLVPSGLSLPGGDMQYKKNQSVHGIKRFIILTTGYPPIPY